MRKQIAVISASVVMLATAGCMSNPYVNTMKSLDAKGGILDQNRAYIEKDTALTKEQKDRRLRENASVRLVIKRSLKGES